MASASPEEVSEAFAAAINAGDVAAAVELWSEDAAIVAPDGGTVRGRSAIAAVLEALIGSATTVEITVSQLYTTAEVALATGTLSLRAPGQEAAQRSDSVVVYTRCADGAWRVAIDAPWGLPPALP